MLDISPVLFSSGFIFLLLLLDQTVVLSNRLLITIYDRTASIKKNLEDAKSNGADVDGLLAEAK